MNEREQVQAWAGLRERHRERREFAAADELRARIEAAGYEVRDTPDGPVVSRSGPFTPIAPVQVPDRRDQPDGREVSVLLLLERFGEPQPAWLADDARRCLDAVLAHVAGHDVEVLLLDDGAGGAAGKWAAEAARADDRVEAVHLADSVGFGAARALQHRMATGRVVLWLDTGVELIGDLFGPLLAAFEDPTVGAAGKWGARLGDSVTHFEAVEAPAAPHAVWGYLLGLRRDLLRDGRVSPDAAYGFYRHADADVCLQVRAAGARAALVDLPAVQHAHRGYAATAAEVVTRESRRNYRRLLDRWREQMQQLVAGSATTALY